MAVTTLNTAYGNTTGPSSAAYNAFRVVSQLGYDSNAYGTDGYDVYQRRYVEVTKSSGSTFTSNFHVNWQSATISLSTVKTYADTGWVKIGRKSSGTNLECYAEGYYDSSSAGILKSTATAKATVPALPTYTIEYYANGGSGAPAKQTKTYGVGLTLSSIIPTRTGYVFIGWSTSSTATSASYVSGGTYTNNSSIKLYAVWKINIFFDVNHDNIGQNYFITNGGSLGFNYGQNFSYDVGITYSFEPIPNNVVLHGTQTNSFALGALKGLDINEGDTFYITLTYVSGEIKQQSGDAISSGGCFVLDFKDVSTRQYRDIYLPTADNPIYTGSITATSATASTANTLAYWIWKNNGFIFNNYRFKVKIEKSTNSEYSPIVINNSSSNTYNYGNALPVPQSRLGYTFDAWYTQKTGGNAVSLNSTVDISNGNVLYAHWNPNKYTITFDGNGGTTTVDSLEVAYETTQNNDVSQYIPQRQAYEFLGWYTSPTDGVQVYDANGLCTNDGTYWLNDVCVNTNDYTLYAQWKALNIAYYKHEGEWKLCRTYIKVDNTWKPAIMYIKSNNKYIR